MEEIMNAITSVATALGIDAILVLTVVVGTYLLRLIFKPKAIFTPILYALIIGIPIGIIVIIVNKAPITEWLRTILGYPVTGICLYMIYRKIFPDAELLKPPEVIAPITLTEAGQPPLPPSDINTQG